MNAAIAGYSGLTGSFLTNRLREEKSVDSIFLVGRKPVDDQDEKLKHISASFEQIEKTKSGKIHAGFCVLGTTIKKAGSRENFRKVDYEYVLSFAKFCKENGADSFHLMSSVGASSSSSNFYLKTKGDVEKAVGALGFESLYIYRPSMLLGPRKEFRLGEMIGKMVMKVLNLVFIGPLEKYKAIHVDTVAASMVSNARSSEKGTHVLYFRDMR